MWPVSAFVEWRKRRNKIMYCKLQFRKFICKHSFRWNHTLALTSALVFISCPPLPFLSCHAGVLLIVHALKKIQQRELNKQSERRAAHGEDFPPCVFFSFLSWNTPTVCWPTQTHIETRLINTWNFSGVFIVHYNTHTQTARTLTLLPH